MNKIILTIILITLVLFILSLLFPVRSMFEDASELVFPKKTDFSKVDTKGLNTLTGVTY